MEEKENKKISSREAILTRIRRHTAHTYEMPDLTLEHLVYDDKQAVFMESLKQAGGEAVVLQPGETADEVILRLYPDARRIGSNLEEIACATFNPDEVDDPRLLNGTDVAVVKGDFGVAENAAVWLAQRVRHKAVYFIPRALVILLDKHQIVDTMHEAYRRLEKEDYPFGTFMSGPSKTADIEQALVFGAHGPVRVSVLLR